MPNTTSFGALVASLYDTRCDARRLESESAQDSATREEAASIARVLTQMVARLDTARSLDVASIHKEAASNG